jgi:hypothetical protein
MIYNIFVRKYFLYQFQQKIKQWAKPATLSLISGVISDLPRSRSDLIVENALLRQQLIVLHRQVTRPMFNQHDRFCLVLLARFTRFWKQTLHIAQPDTLLRWHRDLFRFYWRLKQNANKTNQRSHQKRSISFARWQTRIAYGERSGFGVNYSSWGSKCANEPSKNICQKKESHHLPARPEKIS